MQPVDPMAERIRTADIRLWNVCLKPELRGFREELLSLLMRYELPIDAFEWVVIALERKYFSGGSPGNGRRKLKPPVHRNEEGIR